MNPLPVSIFSLAGMWMGGWMDGWVCGFWMGGWVGGWVDLIMLYC